MKDKKCGPIRQPIYFPFGFSSFRYCAPAILAISVGVYLNTIGNGFVYDDMSLISQNEAIRDYRNIPGFFKSDLWGILGRASNFYRPIPPTIYTVVYHFAGLKPWVYHSVNIIFHAATSLLAFLICSNVVNRSRPGDPAIAMWSALAASIVFATHPVHAEAVAWIAGIMDLACAFFSLLSVYLYLISDKNRVADARYLLSLVSFFLGSLTKEPALVVPVALLIADYILAETNERSVSASTKRIAPFFIVAAIYLAMRMSVLKGLAPIASGETSPGWHDIVLIVPHLFAQYLKLLFSPFELTVLHDIPPPAGWLSWKAAVSSVVVAVFAAGCLIAARRDQAMFLGFVFLALPLAPALYLPGLTQDPRYALAERYAYFGSFGLSLILASALAWAGARNRRLFFAGLTAMVAVSAVFAAVTWERNYAWKDNHSLWSDAIKKAPRSSIAHKHFGLALINRGENAEGRRHLAIALALDPRIPAELIGRGILYSNKGMINKAIMEFSTALLFQSDSVDANYNLGLAYHMKGWSKEAINQYGKVLSIRPDHLDARVNLGIAYAETGRMEEAIRQFGEAVRLKPDDAAAKYNLEKALKMR